MHIQTNNDQITYLLPVYWNVLVLFVPNNESRPVRGHLIRLNNKVLHSMHKIVIVNQIVDTSNLYHTSHQEILIILFRIGGVNQSRIWCFQFTSELDVSWTVRGHLILLNRNISAILLCIGGANQFRKWCFQFTSEPDVSRTVRGHLILINKKY